MARMSRSDFEASVEYSVIAIKEGHAETEIRNIESSNGKYRGLVVKSSRGGRFNVSPTINLDNLWEDYEKGVPYSYIAKRVEDMMNFRCPIDIESFNDYILDYEKVKDRLFVSLVNQDKGIKAEASEKIEDLLLVAKIMVKNSDKDMASAVVVDDLLRIWDKEGIEVLRDAKENSEKILPYELIDMAKMAGIECEDAPLSYIVTNENKVQGASVLFYPGMMRRISREYKRKYGDGGFYILPSSVHEVITMPKDDIISPEMLRLTVHEANEGECMNKNDILSYEVYEYLDTSDKIRIVK